jgi:uncharacterized membrane protein
MDFSLLGLQGLRQVFNVHPVFVHFPIALFPSALLLYGLGIALNWRAACIAGRACLYLATAGTLLAVMTGLMAQDTFPHSERIHHMMQTHKTLGLLIGPLSLILAGWSVWHKAQQPRVRYGFLLGLLLLAGLVIQNADLGARMVFIEGAAVKPAIAVITSEHEAGHGDSESIPHHHEQEGSSRHHH